MTLTYQLEGFFIVLNLYIKSTLHFPFSLDSKVPGIVASFASVIDFAGCLNNFSDCAII